jgi:replicative DNA helicase
MLMEDAEARTTVTTQVITVFQREHALVRHAAEFPFEVLETGLSPEHFEVRDYRFAWQVMKTILGAGAVRIGQAIPPNTLLMGLRMQYRGEDHYFHGAGGDTWLHDLYSGGPPAAAFALKVLVPELFARYRLRQQRSRFELLADRVDKEPNPLPLQRDWQDEAERTVNEPDGGDVGTTLTAIVQRLDARDASHKNLVPLGLPKIDRANGGGHGRGDLCVIGAGTNVGKSYTSQRLLRNQAKAGRRALHISIEDDEDLMSARTIADYSREVIREGVAPAEIRLRAVDPEVIDRAAALVAKECGDLIRYIDAHKATVGEVCRIMRRNRVLFAVDLVIVDYLQAIQSDEPTNNRTNDVALIVSSLKKCAKEIGVALVLMSQVTREEYRDGVEPTISACKWAGEIENESEIMILLWRDEQDVLHAKVAKLKWSKALSLRFIIEVDPKTGCFLDWHDDFGPTQDDRRERRSDRVRQKAN